MRTIALILAISFCVFAENDLVIKKIGNLHKAMGIIQFVGGTLISGYVIQQAWSRPSYNPDIYVAIPIMSIPLGVAQYKMGRDLVKMCDK